MPTVRCPTCRRALHLPENREVTTAQCPLCQTTFDAPTTGSVPTVPAGPAPIPTQSVTPLPVDPPEPPRRARARETFEFDNESSEQTADRRAISSAVWWLKAAATAGLVHALTCGCFDNLDSAWGSSHSGPPPTGLLWMFWLVRLFALFFVYSAAESFSRRRSRGHVAAGCVITFLVALYVFYRTLMVVAYFVTGPNAAPEGSCFAIVPGLVAVVNLIAGIRTVAVLNRPGVRALFER